MPSVEKTEKFKFSAMANFSDKQQEATNALSNYKYILYGGA